jgi:hypothetical protein
MENGQVSAIELSNPAVGSVIEVVWQSLGIRGDEFHTPKNRPFPECDSGCAVAVSGFGFLVSSFFPIHKPNIRISKKLVNSPIGRLRFRSFYAFQVSSFIPVPQGDRKLGRWPDNCVTLTVLNIRLRSSEVLIKYLHAYRPYHDQTGCVRW